MCAFLESSPTPGGHGSAFCHYWLVSAVPEVYINGFIRCVLPVCLLLFIYGAVCVCSLFGSFLLLRRTLSGDTTVYLAACRWTPGLLSRLGCWAQAATGVGLRVFVWPV